MRKLTLTVVFLCICLIVLIFTNRYIYDNGVIMSKLELKSKGVIYDSSLIEDVEHPNRFTTYTDLEMMPVASSLRCRQVADLQAKFWDDECELIEVFCPAFRIVNGEAKSIVWYFIYRGRNEKKLLLVSANEERVLRVGQYRDTKRNFTHLEPILNWNFDSSVFHMHLRTIQLNRRPTTVWVLKRWSRINRNLTPQPDPIIYDANTGIEMGVSSNNKVEMVEPYGLFRNEETNFRVGIINSKGSDVLSSDLQLICTAQARKLESGELALHYDYNREITVVNAKREEVARGTIIVKFDELSNMMSTVLYENGEYGYSNSYFVFCCD